MRYDYETPRQAEFVGRSLAGFVTRVLASEADAQSFLYSRSRARRMTADLVSSLGCNYRLQGGEMCGADALVDPAYEEGARQVGASVDPGFVRMLSRSGMCGKHARDLYELFGDHMLREATERERELRAIHADKARRLDELNERTYLLQRSDGLVKIGRTRAMEKRKRDLERTYGPLNFLLVTRGDFESRLHQQFEKSRHIDPDDRRSGASEWFLPTAALVTFVNQYADQTDPASPIDLPDPEDLGGT